MSIVRVGFYEYNPERNILLTRTPDALGLAIIKFNNPRGRIIAGLNEIIFPKTESANSKVLSCVYSIYSDTTIPLSDSEIRINLQKEISDWININRETKNIHPPITYYYDENAPRVEINHPHILSKTDYIVYKREYAENYTEVFLIFELKVNVI